MDQTHHLSSASALAQSYPVKVSSFTGEQVFKAFKGMITAQPRPRAEAHAPELRLPRPLRRAPQDRMRGAEGI